MSCIVPQVLSRPTTFKLVILSEDFSPSRFTQTPSLTGTNPSPPAAPSVAPCPCHDDTGNPGLYKPEPANLCRTPDLQRSPIRRPPLLPWRASCNRRDRACHDNRESPSSRPRQSLRRTNPRATDAQSCRQRVRECAVRCASLILCE